MDYLFMIELNDQTANLVDLQSTIHSLGEEILYLAVDELDKGLVGIVRFSTGKTDVDRGRFFDKIREQVAGINQLPLKKVDSRTLTQDDLPKSADNLSPSTPARWARASMGDVLVGFDAEGTPNLNSDINTYHIVSMLKGGIGGKH